MKTLILHAPDPTTNFLSNYPSDATIIRTDIGDSLIRKLIKNTIEL